MLGPTYLLDEGLHRKHLSEHSLVVYSSRVSVMNKMQIGC